MILNNKRRPKPFGLRLFVGCRATQVQRGLRCPATQERDLELREGLGELLDRFQSRFISKVLGPHRPNVATD